MDTFFVVRFRRSGLHLRSSGVPETFVISCRSILFRWFVCAAVVLFIQARRKPSINGTTVSDVFFHAVGEKALNHYNIFAIHCQYHTCYISANYCFGKSCIALILLFYSHYLVACTRLLLLWVVYNVLSPKLSNNSVRELIWNSFAMSVDL